MDKLLRMLPDLESVNYVEKNQVGDDALWVDIRSPEAFQKQHLQGAENCCVYEVAFTEKMSAMIPDKTRAIVVYGLDEQHRGAEYAFEKLKTAGYSRIAVLKGGLSSVHANLIESSINAVPGPGAYELNIDKSKLRWFGRNLMNGHEGTVSLSEGALEIDQATTESKGQVVVDMTKIDCDDLTEETGKQGLLDHLKSIDFFDVYRFPEARFELSQLEWLEASARSGDVNAHLNGRFLIRGITRDFDFPAYLFPIENGLGIQAQFDFDRSKWNVLYGSGSVFEGLGMHLVCDLVTLHLHLFFDRS